MLSIQVPFAKHKALPNIKSIGIAAFRRSGFTAAMADGADAKYLGQQIGRAIRELPTTPAQVARDFGVKPPSVNGWVKTGRISKHKLPKLVEYFNRPLEWFVDRHYKGSDKIPPRTAEHGPSYPPVITAGTIEEKNLLFAFRNLMGPSRRTLLLVAEALLVRKKEGLGPDPFAESIKRKNKAKES